MVKQKEVLTINLINRDECRTPIQWDTSSNAGFSQTGIETWLPINEKTYKDRNVKIQNENKDSLLNCYRRFLKLRKETPALQSGSISLLSLPKVSKSLLAYKRKINFRSDSESVNVFLNMNKKAIDFSNPSEEMNLLISTTINSNPVKNDKITLLPWDGVVMY